MTRADDQPSVNVLVRADPIVHYTIKSTVNGHRCRWRAGLVAVEIPHIHFVYFVHFVFIFPPSSLAFSCG